MTLSNSGASTQVIMRLFTVEEANAMLPELRALLARITKERTVLRRFGPEIKRAGEHATEGGGSVVGAQYAMALNRVMADVQEIIGLGIEIKDFDRGLCDFPHLRDG